MKSKTRRTPEQEAEHDRLIVSGFNTEYPIGKTVWYWTSLPFGPVKETQIRTQAWTIPSGQTLCSVKGVAGGVSIYNITEVDESRRDKIQFVEETK